MESRSEHAQPEQQAWKPTAYTPQAPGRMAHAESALGVGAVTSSVVCAQVRAQLDLLVENDGSLRPEAATALQVHMAVCTDCAREFREMQRIVNILEAMPLADLPRDFAPLVARRIQAAGLCDRVREKLQPLMDGDPGIGSEMTAALYGHLAVCRQCADEFARLRSMVNLLETLPPAELPIDYSRPIMRRIQESGLAPGLKEQNAVGPTFAASSSVSGEVAIHEALVSGRIQRSAAATTLASARALDTRQSLWQRLIGSVALSGMFIFLLVSDWGRQMMGTNVEAARLWLSQIGDHLQQAPIFGVIIAALAAALGSIGDAAARTFSTLNGVAAQTLAIEVSLGLAACFVLSARRRVTLSGP